MSQRAQAGQMAVVMPSGGRCGRTFLSTFCFSGLSCSTHRARGERQRQRQSMRALVPCEAWSTCLKIPFPGLYLQATRHLLSYGAECGDTLGSCPPGTLPGVACPLTWVSSHPPTRSHTLTGGPSAVLLCSGGMWGFYILNQEQAKPTADPNRR